MEVNCSKQKIKIRSKLRSPIDKKVRKILISTFIVGIVIINKENMFDYSYEALFGINHEEFFKDFFKLETWFGGDIEYSEQESSFNIAETDNLDYSSLLSYNFETSVYTLNNMRVILNKALLIPEKDLDNQEITRYLLLVDYSIIPLSMETEQEYEILYANEMKYEEGFYRAEPGCRVDNFYDEAVFQAGGFVNPHQSNKHFYYTLWIYDGIVSGGLHRGDVIEAVTIIHDCQCKDKSKSDVEIQYKIVVK